MAIFERETKVSIPELRLGETLVAQFVSLTQTIDDGGREEVVLSESAQVLWGVTKEDLIAEADKKILISQRIISLRQEELAKAEELKTELEALAAEEIKP